MSEEFNFTTQPTTGVEALPYRHVSCVLDTSETSSTAELRRVHRLGLIGDVGQTADSAATFRHIVASAPQSILDVGDISCAPRHCLATRAGSACCSAH